MKKQPWQPACRAVQERRRAQQDARHVNRLANVRPSIDMRPPKALKYKKKNTKRLYMEKERQNQIQRENNRMLRNLLEVDPSRREERRKRFSRQDPASGVNFSLNLATRQRNLQRITEENKKLLQRIINCEPTFDRHSFKQRERNHKGLLRRMAENSGNRARPQSARGRPRQPYSEMGLNKKTKKKRGRRRPNSAAPRRASGNASFDGGRNNSRRPRTSMGMRRRKEAAQLY